MLNICACVCDNAPPKQHRLSDKTIVQSPPSDLLVGPRALRIRAGTDLSLSWGLALTAWKCTMWSVNEEINQQSYQSLMPVNDND